MMGDPTYDKTFREMFKVYLAAPPEICARCAQTLPIHAALAFIGESDGHIFMELNRN
jgi:hypothetical protein